MHAQGPPHGQERIAVPGGRAARSHRRHPGARFPRRRLPRGPVRARRPRDRERPRRALPRRAPGGAEDHQARSRGRHRPGRFPAGGLSRHGGAGRLPRTSLARGLRRRFPPPARLLPGRRRVPSRLPARAVHALGPPQLPRRADRAHGGGWHARVRDLHAAPAAELGPAPVRRDPARRGQDARVRSRRRDRAQRGRRAGGSPGARPAARDRAGAAARRLP